MTPAPPTSPLAGLIASVSITKPVITPMHHHNAKHLLVASIGTGGEHYFTASVVDHLMQHAPEDLSIHVLSSPDNALIAGVVRRHRRGELHYTKHAIGDVMAQTFSSSSGFLPTVRELGKLTSQISTDVTQALLDVACRYPNAAIWLTGLTHLFAFPAWSQLRLQGALIGKVDPYLICDTRPGVRELPSHMLPPPRDGRLGLLHNRIVHAVMDRALALMARQSVRLALRAGLIATPPRTPYHHYQEDLGTVYGASSTCPDARQLIPRVYHCPVVVATALTTGALEREIARRTAASGRTLLLQTLGSMTALVGEAGRSRMMAMLLRAADTRPDVQIVAVMPSPFAELPPGDHGDHQNLHITSAYVDMPLLVFAARQQGVAAACALSHGGIGTAVTLACLGLPQTVTPVVSEQHYNAQAAATPTMPVPVYPFTQLAPPVFAAALDELLDRARQCRDWATPAHAERLRQFSSGAATTVAQTMLDLTDAAWHPCEALMPAMAGGGATA